MTTSRKALVASTGPALIRALPSPRPVNPLADLLAAKRDQIERQFETRRNLSGRSERGLRHQVPEFLDDLITALRRQWIEEAAAPRLQSEFELGTVLREYGLLRELIFDVIERSREEIPARDHEIVTAWFMNCISAASAQHADEMKQQHERSVELLDAVPDYLMLSAGASRVLYANRATAEVLPAAAGLSLKELSSKSGRELGLTDEFMREAAQVENLALSGQVVTREVLFPSASGPRWYEETASPVASADGTVHAVAISGRDIHERKVAQTRLQLLSKMSALVGELEYEDVLAAIARVSIPELADLCVVDAIENGAIRRAHVAHGDPAKADVAQALLQFPPETCFNGQNARIPDRSTLIPRLEPEMPSECALEQAHWAAIQELEPLSMIVLPLIVNGETVAIVTLMSTTETNRIYSEEDLVLAEELARRAALLVEKARLHQELRKNEARFRVALASSNLLMFELDAALRFSWVYSTQHGDKLRGGRGRTDENLLLFESAVRMSASRHRVLETGARVQEELRLRIKGEDRYFVTSFDPLRDAAGTIVGIVGAAVDITAEKRVQEDLAQELGFRERMMGILGHDLRNPLSAVQMSTGLLSKQQKLPENAQRTLRLVERATTRMHEMIETLLDFTKSRSTGHMPISPVQADLADVVRGVVEELRAARPGRLLDLEMKGDGRGEWDPARMAQVVSNLAGNALTYGAEDTPVSLRLEADGNEVVLQVQNWGPVIPAELISTLFEPFRRGPAAESGAAPRGLGLGLHIVRQIVLSHGGTVGVESTAERGTVFTVQLPYGGGSSEGAED